MSEFDEQELMTMKLHEKRYLDNVTILRVYRGWIYTFYKKVHCNGLGDQIAMSSVFVPRN
jgi:hypothetical protein